MPPLRARRDDALPQIRRALDGANRRTATSGRVLCIDGRSGSGKTTLAEDVVADLRAAGFTVETLRLDDLYPGWSGLAAGIDLAARAVSTWVRTGYASVPTYDWQTCGPGAQQRLQPADILVCEGVGSGTHANAAHASVVVWIEAPSAQRRVRALARDGATFAPWWDHWAAQEEHVLAQDDVAARADIILTWDSLG